MRKDRTREYLRKSPGIKEKAKWIEFGFVRRKARDRLTWPNVGYLYLFLQITKIF